MKRGERVREVAVADTLPSYSLDAVVNQRSDSQLQPVVGRDDGRDRVHREYGLLSSLEKIVPRTKIFTRYM